MNFRQLGRHVQEDAKTEGSRGRRLRPPVTFWDLLLILLGGLAKPYATRVSARRFWSKARAFLVKGAPDSGQRRGFSGQRRVGQMVGMRRT